MNRNMWILAAAAVFAAAPVVRAENFTDPTVNNYWAESNTDASGNYISPDQNTSVTGNALVAPIPTDANQATPDNDVVNYVRTRTDLTGASTQYNGTLLGNLSGQASLTATFSLNESALGANSPFTSADFVGEGAPPTSPIPIPSLRLVFTGSTAQTANGDAGASPNEWWSTAGVEGTAMLNGQDVTLTVNFDAADWSNYYGHNGTESPAFTTDFENALSSVEYLGISFGSGDFFSDGFAFDTGGTASLDLSSINTAPAVSTPLPAPLWSGMTLIGTLGLVRGIKRLRRVEA